VTTTAQPDVYIRSYTLKNSNNLKTIRDCIYSLSRSCRCSLLVVL